MDTRHIETDFYIHFNNERIYQSNPYYKPYERWPHNEKYIKEKLSKNKFRIYDLKNFIERVIDRDIKPHKDITDTNYRVGNSLTSYLSIRKFPPHKNQYNALAVHDLRITHADPSIKLTNCFHFEMGNWGGETADYKWNCDRYCDIVIPIEIMNGWKRPYLRSFIRIDKTHETIRNNNDTDHQSQNNNNNNSQWNFKACLNHILNGLSNYNNLLTATSHTLPETHNLLTQTKKVKKQYVDFKDLRFSFSVSMVRVNYAKCICPPPIVYIPLLDTPYYISQSYNKYSNDGYSSNDDDFCRYGWNSDTVYYGPDAYMDDRKYMDKEAKEIDEFIIEHHGKEVPSDWSDSEPFDLYETWNMCNYYDSISFYMGSTKYIKHLTYTINDTFSKNLGENDKHLRNRHTWSKFEESARKCHENLFTHYEKYKNVMHQLPQFIHQTKYKYVMLQLVYAPGHYGYQTTFVHFNQLVNQ